MEQTKKQRIVAIVTAAVVLAGVLGGGIAVASGIQSAHADQQAHAAQVKRDTAEQKEIVDRMFAAAADAKEDQDAAAEADYQKFLADKAAAELKAQADAKAAADEAATRAKADADAAAKAATKTPVNRSTSGGWAAGHAPAGTPIPTFVVTDPNAGNFGQRDIVDPGTFCDSQSGSGDIDHAVCD